MNDSQASARNTKAITVSSDEVPKASDTERGIRTSRQRREKDLRASKQAALQGRWRMEATMGAAAESSRETESQVSIATGAEKSTGMDMGMGVAVGTSMTMCQSAGMVVAMTLQSSTEEMTKSTTAEVKRLQDEVADLTKLLNIEQNQKKSLTEELERSKLIQNQALQALDERLQDLVEAEQELEEKVHDSKNKEQCLEGLDANLQQHRKEITGLGEQLMTCRHNLASMEERAKIAESSLFGAQTELRQSQTVIFENKAVIACLRTKCDAVEAELEKAERKLTSTSQELVACYRLSEEKAREISKLEALHQSLGLERQQVASEKEMLEVEVRKLTEDVEISKSAIMKMNASIEDLERQIEKPKAAHKDKLDRKYTAHEHETNELEFRPPEETDMMTRLSEKRAGERIVQTWVEGQPSPDLHEAAITLKVGLTFMPGADKPQVNRLEQQDMTGQKLDQRDSYWRVHTAGLLLSTFDVTRDLSVVQKDQTAEIAEKARTRVLREAKDGHAPPANSMRALTARGRDYEAVNIDSNEVYIVNDLREKRAEWDLESTLIEVDGSSLVRLMTTYRNLIHHGGPHISFNDTKEILNIMIENAYHLCVRSPILFRMSTRSSIIHSKNTRYGVNNGSYFQTITTSRGIVEMILLSTAYFHSLEPEYSSDSNTTRKYIRPRFLQMIVLLLSLLNDDDLAKIADFLELTYHLKANRQHLELLFMKVMPLMSINSKVFLKAIVSVYKGFPLNQSMQENLHSHCWNTFIQRILNQGYLLPGTVNDLGRNKFSWIMKWPKEGFRSSNVFNNLQYIGSDSRTFNEIPPVDLHPEASLKEVTVQITNNDSYTIDSSDLENHSEDMRHRIDEDEDFSDEPIIKAIYPGANGPTDPAAWQDYHAGFTHGCLHVDAKQFTVASALWTGDDIIKVILHQHQSKFFVAPLKPVNKVSRKDEIQVGNIAILAGYYMIIAVQGEGASNWGYVMKNYLRINSVDAGASRSRRGQNRRAQREPTSTAVFV